VRRRPSSCAGRRPLSRVCGNGEIEAQEPVALGGRQFSIRAAVAAGGLPAIRSAAMSTVDQVVITPRHGAQVSSARDNPPGRAFGDQPDNTVIRGRG